MNRPTVTREATVSRPSCRPWAAGVEDRAPGWSVSATSGGFLPGQAPGAAKLSAVRVFEVPVVTEEDRRRAFSPSAAVRLVFQRGDLDGRIFPSADAAFAAAAERGYLRPYFSRAVRS